MKHLHSEFRIQDSGFLLLLLVVGAGCNYAGAIAYKVAGPPAVPAQYVPMQEPLLVLVENYDQPTGSQVDAEMLQRMVYDQFATHEIAPLVELEKLYNLKTRLGDAGYRKLSIAAVGREVGAKQVLYVNLQQASVEPVVAAEFYQGRGAASVRVVDADTGSTRWPPDMSHGYGVSFETPLPRGEDRSNAALARQELHKGLAEQVGRLFRKWKPENLDGT